MQKMRVLYDHQAFSYQEFGGVSRMFCEVLAQFQQTRAVSFELPLKYSNNVHVQALGFARVRNPHALERRLAKLPIPAKSVLLRILRKLGVIPFTWVKRNQRHVLKAIEKGDFDVFHPTYYDDYFLGPLERVGKPFVITVYDMIHERFPGFFDEQDSVFRTKKSLCERAARVITISQSTKDDLVGIYGIDPDKIVIVPLAARLPKPHATIQSVDHYIKKYILFVGHRWIYKNFGTLIEGLAEVLRADPELFVVCAGSRRFDSEEIALLSRLGVRSQVVHISISSDDLLARLYSKAALFVYPSLYEGFGIPLLEAFQSGCPVVCSDASSFPEVAGDAAVYFSPGDPGSIAAAVRQVLGDGQLRDRLAARGRERWASFSWQNSARLHQAVYESAAKL